MPTFDAKVTLADVKVLRATDKALLCEIDGAHHWIPQSQIDDDSEIWKAGDEGDLVISEWIAIEKGLA